MAGYKGSNINPKKFERGQIKIIILLLPLAIFMGIPIVFIVCHAFKPIDELFAFPPQILVHKPTLENFSKLFKASQSADIPMSRYVFNSIIVTAVVVIASIFMSTMAGYALSKLKFKGKNTILEVNNMALMFVAVAVMIPRYLIIDMLGIKDTYLAHILPLLAMPVGLFLVKQFIDQIPDALIEAAYIDGASDFKIYRKIILPLIKPAISTTVILAFQQVWTNVESSNLYINNESMKTLAFYLNTLSNANNTVAGQGIQAAGILIQFIPNLLIFLILRKSFMNTMAHSGIK
ncbi:MAG: carbohydrate ABC transporter permease [Lachnospiraceae bacterium]|uniref:carbohydrate ABC transporter permease n=1 Tax=Falcatimonas sp. MSJ-15 TaxID=2841515 RepID=UPI001C112968|nr:carbohydrate ABC transporter permease [Falcatimonas sp. MSJ-15]MBQ5735593.1 carbohydrate ABC transporter permease [Lachnospiraceae bacterium]MBU5470481.1 carbohydrate ABC transporter permease [Falcatimonas sp. MSJ-15]